MIPGAPQQARWVRAEPRRSLPAATLERIVDRALPGERVVRSEPLADGLRNANFKLHLERAPEAVVLRLYEHDASLCRKELDLMRLVAGSVPVPEVIYAAPDGLDDLPPWRVTRWVEGIPFRELKRAGDAEAIGQAAYAAGEVLAAAGHFRFAKAGWLLPGPQVGAPILEGTDAMPRFIDLCLASVYLRERVPAGSIARARELVWQAAPIYAAMAQEALLVHGDFNKRNLLVRRVAGRWKVAALLDWEFAVAGCPLADVGVFLRYERPERPVAEPHFSNGYRAAGGRLPPDWRRGAWLLDLAALGESLTHAMLPAGVVAELAEVWKRTIEHAGL